MNKAVIQLEELACPSCMLKIEGAAKSVEGVDKDSVNVSFNSSKLKFDFDESKVSVNDVEDAIKKIGYQVIKSTVKSR